MKENTKVCGKEYRYGLFLSIVLTTIVAFLATIIVFLVVADSNLYETGWRKLIEIFSLLSKDRDFALGFLIIFGFMFLAYFFPIRENLS
ncbi:hypothetical protein K0B04_01520 [Patescibacteria group bacterium]|nr:hypothetical protein [Patescibacteria group bacterium]